MASLPPFTKSGILPAGDYELSLRELKTSFLVTGPQPTIADWDAEWREQLINQAAVLIRQLWQVGIDGVFLNGSFVEDKPHPNDIDGYFECDLKRLASGDLTRELNALDPHSIWTWDPNERKSYRGYAKRQLPMWHVYRVELYPHYHFGPSTGITDQYGNQRLFPAAFRRRRDTDEEKGIVKIIRDA